MYDHLYKLLVKVEGGGSRDGVEVFADISVEFEGGEVSISVRDTWPVASLTERETWTESMVVKPMAVLIASLRARGEWFQFSSCRV